MKRLFGYMRRFAWRYAFGIFCTFITATLAMIVPYLPAGESTPSSAERFPISLAAKFAAPRF